MLGLGFIQFPVNVRDIENCSYALTSNSLIKAINKRIIERFRDEASCTDPRVECEFKISLYFSHLKGTHSRDEIINILQATYMVLFAMEHCAKRLDRDYFWQIKDFFVIIFAHMIKNQKMEQIFEDKKLEDAKYNVIKREIKNFFPQWQSILHGKLPKNPFPDLSFERANAGFNLDGVYRPLIEIVHGLLNDCAIADYKVELEKALDSKLQNQNCCFRFFRSKNIKITLQDVESQREHDRVFNVEDRNAGAKREKEFLIPKKSDIDNLSLGPGYGATSF